jgi:hypothetical protein
MFLSCKKGGPSMAHLDSDKRNIVRATLLGCEIGGPSMAHLYNGSWKIVDNIFKLQNVSLNGKPR